MFKGHDIELKAKFTVVYLSWYSDGFIHTIQQLERYLWNIDDTVAFVGSFRGVNISHHFEILGKIFDLNQNSFVQQKMLPHKPVSFILTSLGHVFWFYHFCEKTFSNVFPELKIEDKIITYYCNTGIKESRKCQLLYFFRTES